MTDGIRPINKKPWSPQADGKERLESATQLARLVTSAEGLHKAHRREILSIAVWKATEADSKMNPRYRTIGIRDGEIGTPVNHEHVVTRKFLVDAMLSAPQMVPEIMKLATGCLVTREEHKLLSKANAWGWGRYIEADLSVIDGKNGSMLVLEKEHRRLRRIANDSHVKTW